MFLPESCPSSPVSSPGEESESVEPSSPPSGLRLALKAKHCSVFPSTQSPNYTMVSSDKPKRPVATFSMYSGSISSGSVGSYYMPFYARYFCMISLAISKFASTSAVDWARNFLLLAEFSSYNPLVPKATSPMTTNTVCFIFIYLFYYISNNLLIIAIDGR